MSGDRRDKLEQGWSGSCFSLQESGSDGAGTWQEKLRPKAAPDLGAGEAEGVWLFQVLCVSKVSRRVTTGLSVVAWKHVAQCQPLKRKHGCCFLLPFSLHSISLVTNLSSQPSEKGILGNVVPSYMNPHSF